MQITTDYKNEIFAKVMKMSDGQALPIEQDQHYEKKVETLKLIMDWRMPEQNGFSLTFNNNYSKIRRDDK